MNEEKLIENLINEFKKHFPTKEEHYQFQNNTESRLTVIEEKIDDLKSSANAFDKLLEQHPTERIGNLEKHTKAPPLALSIKEE